MDPAHVRQVLARGEAQPAGEALRNVAGPRPPGHPARGRRGHAGHDAQQRRLAAAVRSLDLDQPTCSELLADAAYDPWLTQAVALAHRLELHARSLIADDVPFRGARPLWAGLGRTYLQTLVLSHGPRSGTSANAQV